MKKIIFPFLLLSLSMTSVSQNPLSLYFLENVPQSSTLNPALQPRANFYLGIPGVNTIYTSVNSDVSSGIVQEKDDGVLLIGQEGFDYTDLLNDIGDAANVTAYQTIAPFIMGFRTKRGYFTFGWTEKVKEELSVPKDLFNILDKGFINGSTYDFSQMATDAKYFREWSLGYSFNFSKNLRFGMHLKFLQGLVAIKSDINDISVQTNNDLWKVSMDGAVYMSAPVYVSYDENGIPSFDSIPSDKTTLIDKGIFNFSNPGFALDFGMAYSKNKFDFSMALNNLGFIMWKGDDLNSFYANGSYTFESLDEDEEISDLVDSIKVAVNFTHGNEAFKMMQRPELYLGARYNLSNTISLGLLSRTVFNRYYTKQDFNASANFNFYHILTTSFNYTLSINGTNALGTGIALRFGPLQFYSAMDYVPYKYKKNTVIINPDDPEYGTEVPIMPEKFSCFNIMFGFNFIIGANGCHDKPMIEPSSGF